MSGQGKHNMGAGGNCTCPKCEYKQPHQNGVRCREHRCPNCDVILVREGSEHHQLFLKKSK